MNKEYEDLKIIFNKKSVYKNTIYKLSKDENIKIFLKTFIEKSANYESLEHMDKYYFKDNLEEYFKVVNLLLNSLLRDNDFKNYRGEDFYKCCHVFPDYLGEKFIEHISYLPLMKSMMLLFKKIEYSGKLSEMEKYQIEKPMWKKNIEKTSLEDFVDEKCSNNTNSYLDYQDNNDIIESEILKGK